MLAVAVFISPPVAISSEVNKPIYLSLLSNLDVIRFLFRLTDCAKFVAMSTALAPSGKSTAETGTLIKTSLPKNPLLKLSCEMSALIPASALALASTSSEWSPYLC